MKKSIYRWLLEQKTEWAEFVEETNLKSALCQIGFGSVVAIAFVLILGVGELICDFICR